MALNDNKYATQCSRILSSNRVEQAWDNFCIGLQHFGFTRIIYISTQFKTFGNWGDPKDTLILSSHDEKYNKKLFSESVNFMESYPNFGHLLKNPGSYVSFDEIQNENFSYHKAKNLIKLNNKFNISNGIAFSLEQTGSESACVVILTGSSIKSQIEIEEIWKSFKEKIISMAKLLQLKIRELPHSEDGIGPKHEKLTKRQIEVLRLLSIGEPINRIASILEVSVPTIDKHLRLARFKLNVSTTAQAVSKASKENMLLTSSFDQLEYH